MMKKVISVLVFLVTAAAFSQQVYVNGQVLDSEFNNEPLAFAHVKVKGLDLETVSDEKGNFTLALTPGDYTFEVEFIGYQTRMISDVKVGVEALELDPVILEARKYNSDVSLATNPKEVGASKE